MTLPHFRFSIIGALAGAALCAFAWSADPAAPAVPDKPLAKKGSVLFSDDFERSDLGKDWKVVVPTFTVANGVMTGSQTRDDHGAVASVAVPFQDAVIEFKFRFEGASGINAVCDDKAYTGSHAGHICRVTITPQLIRLGDDKEGGMRNDIMEMRKDPARKAEGDKLLVGRTATFNHPLEEHRWYRMTIEIAGDEMRVCVDDQPIGYLKSPGIGHPTKSNFHFTVGGKDAQFGAVRIWAAERGDLKWIDADGVRIVEPPAEHPRLYLRASDVADLRRRMEHPALKPIWNELQTLASTNPQTRLEVDAMRYLLDHDEDLGRRTAAESLRLIQEVKLRGEKQDSSRKIGRMMVTTAIVYDWCHAVLTPEQKKAFCDELVRLARDLECGYPPDKGSFIIGHPSEWMILRDLLSAGVATYDEFPEMYRLTAGRIFKSHVPARNWWYPGNAFHQGPGYADARFVSDMYATWIFGRMGATKVFDPAQQYVPYEWIYLRRPDGLFVRSADGQNWPTRMGTLLCASYYHDGYLLANYLKSPPVIDAVEGSRLAYDTRMDNLFDFLWRDPDLKPLPLTDLPLSRYFGFPYGWMVARTGWGDDTVIAQMKVNIYNFGGHEHCDGGTFEIYHRGPLAIHAGVYQGTNGSFGSSHYINYYKRTIAHNSLLIYDPNEKFRTAGREIGNDGGQLLVNGGHEALTLDDILNGTYKTGKVLGEGFGPDPQKPAYTYLKGDITQAYGPKAREVQRSFVFLNLGGEVPAALLVFDRVVAADPTFAKYWLLQGVEEPTVDGNQSTVAPTGNGWSGKLVNTTLLPQADNLKISKVGGPGQQFWVFGKEYPNAMDPPDPEMGGWRVEVSPTRPSATDFFLNAIQIMDRQSQPIPIEKVECESMVGVHLADRLVFFNTGGERAAGPVTFTATGMDTLRILMTDLAEGSWNVSRDGQVVQPNLKVTTDAGTLYFEGTPGRYTLTR